jgi:hypothetical protein
MITLLFQLCFGFESSRHRRKRCPSVEGDLGFPSDRLKPAKAMDGFAGV